MHPKTPLHPAVLLLVLKMATNLRLANAQTGSGTQFLVVFPENLAYFYPQNPKNQVHITALRPDTEVTLIFRKEFRREILHAPQTRRFVFGGAELGREEFSDKVVRVNSTKEITVHSVSIKTGSIWTSRVLPLDALGTEYLVPPVPRILGTSEPVEEVSAAVTERSPFRLVVVNTGTINGVTLEGEDDVKREVEVEPHHVAQFWLHPGKTWRVLKARHPVAVLFGHPCATTQNCTCSVLFGTLNPKSREEMVFVVPPPVFPDSEAHQTAIIWSQETPYSTESWSSLSGILGTVLVHWPGLLLPLIPQTELASCFVVNGLADVRNLALILVRRDRVGGVRVGGGPPEDPAWQDLLGTDYVSTVVNLSLDVKAVWHTFGKMAVYYVGVKDGARFGNPASAVSQISDNRGCVLSSEVLEIGAETLDWRESIKYCRDRKLHLVSLSSLQLRDHLLAKLKRKLIGNGVLQRAWIGLRRSSLTGHWYWLDGVTVTVANWEEAEPEGPQGGRCGTIGLETAQNFSWSRRNCCQKFRPICYRGPSLFPLALDDS
ncbi:uncharacterized protein LOC144199706 [Stigmatopora nigra]